MQLGGVWSCADRRAKASLEPRFLEPSNYPDITDYVLVSCAYILNIGSF